MVAVGRGGGGGDFKGEGTTLPTATRGLARHMRRAGLEKYGLVVDGNKQVSGLCGWGNSTSVTRARRRSSTSATDGLANTELTPKRRPQEPFAFFLTLQHCMHDKTGTYMAV